MSKVGISVALAATIALAAPPAFGVASAAVAGAPSHCSPGSHSLGRPGGHLYPDTGNGGYRSVHTNVHMVYDATVNRFLAGNRVTLIDRATRCLTSFSVDLERSSSDATAGPDLNVDSVRVDGEPAAFTFVQPTYPGDPAGPNDPDPAAHQASQTNPVGGPNHNPLPPACSPQLPASDASTPDALDGTPCPANKLVITPSQSIASGRTFSVTIAYTGRPGVHHDGDGTTEGWFRADDGGFVTTEPVGSEAWMPLNNFPTAKPTYDFFDTVATGKTAIANGILMSKTPHPAGAQFPDGSVTWHWRSAAPVASYLVENSVGDFTLKARQAANGITFYEAQDTAIPYAQRVKNEAVLDLQQGITTFESHFNGPYPFTSAGVIVGTPLAGFEEEMQTMITFAAGRIDTGTLYHENMHQWWGDNVTESGYDATFYKEGFATLAQVFATAQAAEDRAGGAATPAGRGAFEASVRDQFDAIYGSGGGFWTGAPSDPTPASLFSGSGTYTRPAAAYIALRQILGASTFNAALQRVQRRYGGGNIDERQLEAAFHDALPNRSRACSQRLDRFFSEWFDTAYPAGGGVSRPQISGRGLDGHNFYEPNGPCRAP